MSILPGFEDLKARDVVAFNSDGTATVVVGDKVKRFQIQLQPTGCFSGRAIERKTPDQVGERKHTPVALRWAQTDQGAADLERGEVT